MPIFEYECGPCGRVYEVFFRSSSDRPDLTCPNCGKCDARKKFSVFGTKTAGDPGSFRGSSGKSCGGCTSSSCSSCR